MNYSIGNIIERRSFDPSKESKEFRSQSREIIEADFLYKFDKAKELYQGDWKPYGFDIIDVMFNDRNKYSLDINFRVSWNKDQEWVKEAESDKLFINPKSKHDDRESCEIFTTIRAEWLSQNATTFQDSIICVNWSSSPSGYCHPNISDKGIVCITSFRGSSYGDHPNILFARILYMGIYLNNPSLGNPFHYNIPFPKYNKYKGERNPEHPLWKERIMADYYLHYRNRMIDDNRRNNRIECVKCGYRYNPLRGNPYYCESCQTQYCNECWNKYESNKLHSEYEYDENDNEVLVKRYRVRQRKLVLSTTNKIGNYNQLKFNYQLYDMQEESDKCLNCHYHEAIGQKRKLMALFYLWENCIDEIEFDADNDDELGEFHDEFDL